MYYSMAPVPFNNNNKLQLKVINRVNMLCIIYFTLSLKQYYDANSPISLTMIIYIFFF